jgi:hypothetical protein
MAGLVPLCDPSQIGFAADAQAGATNAAAGPSGAAGPCDSANGKFVRSIIKARTARNRFFEAELFADPAWDMLLELYALACEGRRISVSKLSLAAGVPTTTALRWIDKLEAESLVARVDDPLDARRVWVLLSKAGYAAMKAFVDQIRNPDAGL